MSIDTHHELASYVSGVLTVLLPSGCAVVCAGATSPPSVPAALQPLMPCKLHVHFAGKHCAVYKVTRGSLVIAVKGCTLQWRQVEPPDGARCPEAERHLVGQ